MKHLLVIGDGMADNPVPELGGKTPLEAASIPAIDALASRGVVGSVRNCPPQLPAGSETGILSIFGCDPLRYFSGRSPMEAAALGIPLHKGDVCYRCNLVSFEAGDGPLEERRILSHSADSISGEEALRFIEALNADPVFSEALRAAGMEMPPVATQRPLAVEHRGDPSGIRFVPPHDHLGEIVGPLLPCGNAKENGGQWDLALGGGHGPQFAGFSGRIRLRRRGDQRCAHLPRHRRAARAGKGGGGGRDR